MTDPDILPCPLCGSAMMPGDSLYMVEHPSYGSKCDLRDYTLPAFLWDEWAKSRRPPLEGAGTARTDEDRLKSAGYTYNDLWEVWFGPGGKGCGTLAEALAHFRSASFTPSNTGETP